MKYDNMKPNWFKWLKHNIYTLRYSLKLVCVLPIKKKGKKKNTKHSMLLSRSWHQCLHLGWVTQCRHEIKNDQTQGCIFQIFNKSHLGYCSYIYRWDILQLFWVTVTCLDHFVYLNVYFVQNKKANIIFLCIKNIS